MHSLCALCYRFNTLRNHCGEPPKIPLCSMFPGPLDPCYTKRQKVSWCFIYFLDEFASVSICLTTLLIGLILLVTEESKEECLLMENCKFKDTKGNLGT